MPRWHHSDSSSERYQEVKSIKTFYAAHISRSQAKSMFGNWTNTVTSVSPSLKKGHGKVAKKRALSARGSTSKGHFQHTPTSKRAPF